MLPISLWFSYASADGRWGGGGAGGPAPLQFGLQRLSSATRPESRADVDLCSVGWICADLHTAPETEPLAGRHDPPPPPPINPTQSFAASCFSMKCATFHGLSSILHLFTVSCRSTVCAGGDFPTSPGLRKNYVTVRGVGGGRGRVVKLLLSARLNLEEQKKKKKNPLDRRESLPGGVRARGPRPQTQGRVARSPVVPPQL